MRAVRISHVLYIQLPIILRQTLPGLLMIQVAMLHATLFASLISVNEIFRVAQQINSIVYKPVEIYTALGILFLAICLPMNGLALWLRKQLYKRLFGKIIKDNCHAQANNITKSFGDSKILARRQFVY